MGKNSGWNWVMYHKNKRIIHFRLLLLIIGNAHYFLASISLAMAP